MTQLSIMHEQFENKLYVLEKKEALNNRESEVEDAIAVLGYKQTPRSKPGTTNPK